MSTQERIVCLNGEVDETMSASIVAQLLFLEADNPQKPIHLYINSPGGSVTAGSSFLPFVLPLPLSLPPIPTYLPQLTTPRPRNLRHNDLHSLTSEHDLRRASGLNGLPPSVRRPSRQTVLSPPLVDNDAPAIRRVFWTSERHRHPREGNPPGSGPAQPDI